jgi:hypothetical protein
VRSEKSGVRNGELGMRNEELEVGKTNAYLLPLEPISHS